MLNKLKDAEKHYLELEAALATEENMADMDKYTALTKEYKSMTPLMEKYREYSRICSIVEDARLMMEEETDPELRQMAVEEYREESEKIPALEDELKILLLPPDPNDSRNVVVEIRAGVGGEEAALFAGVLYRMYGMYADSMKYKTELVGSNETGLGGFKEITFIVRGEGAYSRLKYESGVHRVQRVPETETSGRIHTSTATVAVLPEAEDVEVEINPADLEIDTIKSSGAGGQHVNKTESAIRLLHKPTGIVVECQDERSQHKNKDKAMKILRTKLYDMKQKEQSDKIAGERKLQVGSGDRSERIRTYNFPQGRVSDHRIGLTLYSLDRFVDGEINEMIDALATADAAERLSAGGAQ